MKKLGFITFILSVFVLSGCQDDSESFKDEALAEMDLEAEVAAETSLEEVDLIAEAGMETLSESSSGRFSRDEILACAMIDKDTVNRVITIDFGEGCESENGSVRRGKVIVTYNQRRYVVGAFRTITFEDFFIDSVRISGTRKVENTSDSTSTLHFSVTQTGTLSFPDGTTYSRDANHTRTWHREELRLDDYATLIGEASGINRRGEAYRIKIIEELVFNRRCRRGRIVVPVAGVIQKTVGDKVATIDFGAGDCDNLALVTIDGESKRVKIYPRFRRIL